MGQSHKPTVSEINGDLISQKSKNVSTAVYFAPPLTGFSVELGVGVRN